MLLELIKSHSAIESNQFETVLTFVMSLLSSKVVRVKDLAYEVVVNFYIVSPVETNVLLESSVTPS